MDVDTDRGGGGGGGGEEEEDMTFYTGSRCDYMKYE
jgi:hypothetical protein